MVFIETATFSRLLSPLLDDDNDVAMQWTLMGHLETS